MTDPAEARRSDALVQAGLILASELSLPAVLQKIIDLACSVADARYGALGVLAPGGGIGEFITHGITDAEYKAIGDLPKGRGILGALIEDARPLRLRRIQQDPRSAGFPPNHPPMTTFLGVPITTRGTVFGNLYLTEKRGADEFSEEDENAVVTLATQAAIAIENARLYEQAQAAQHRMAAINEIARQILSGVDTLEVLGIVARRARELVGAAIATVAIPAQDQDELVLCVAEGTGAEGMIGRRFPVEGSLSGEVMRARSAVVLEDAGRDEHVSQPLVASGIIGPAMLVPLVGRDHTFGTLSVGNLHGGPRFSEEQRSLVQLFADQASVVLEHGRLRGELQRLALLEDRERIAQDLHDGVVQSLFAVGMSLQATAAGSEDERVRERLGSAADDIDRAIRDLRNYIFGLRPGVAADVGLQRALDELAEDFRHGSDASITVVVDPQIAPALASRTPNLLHLAREALSNAVRHADAGRITVVLRPHGEGAILEVDDDGSGFDPAEAAGKGHGLGNLGTRATSIGGTLEIETAPGTGTRIRIRFPL